jgi:predicted RNase H-like nuclease
MPGATSAGATSPDAASTSAASTSAASTGAARPQAGVGVDGCRGGWVAAVVVDAALVAMHRATSFVALFERVESTLAAGAHAPPPWLVDMPMGLTHDGQRGLEALLRRELPAALKSSVFPVPARATLEARDYQDACTLNARACGRRLSQQTWNIVGKIRELDSCLRQHGHIRERCLESHPEACFHALLPAGETLPRKRRVAGRRAREALLEQSGVRGAVTWKTLLDGDDAARVAPDDALDAICLAFVASRPARWRCLQDPARTHDELGVRLQLVLPEPMPPASTCPPDTRQHTEQPT